MQPRRAHWTGPSSGSATPHCDRPWVQVLDSGPWNASDGTRTAVHSLSGSNGSGPRPNHPTRRTQAQRHENPDHDRRVSAGVRREWLEHLRTRARPAHPRSFHRPDSAKTRRCRRHGARVRWLSGSAACVRGTQPPLRPQLQQERTAGGLADAASARRDADRADRHRARSTRTDLSGHRGGRQRGRHTGRLHRARLLAGLLLVRSHRRLSRCCAVPVVFGRDDGDVRATTRGARLAPRAALDPVHASKPPAEASRSGSGGCRRRRQLDDRARSREPSTRAARHTHRGHSEPHRYRQAPDGHRQTREDSG